MRRDIKAAVTIHAGPSGSVHLATFSPEFPIPMAVPDVTANLIIPVGAAAVRHHRRLAARQDQAPAVVEATPAPSIEPGDIARLLTTAFLTKEGRAHAWPDV